MRNILAATDASFQAASKVGAFKGAVANLGNSEYHSLKHYWSSSDLKYLSKSSPEHFAYKYFGAGRAEQIKVTDDMALGSLVHCFLLTPDEFEKDFFIIPPLNLRKNEDKEKKENLIKNNPGKTPVTDELIQQAVLMTNSAMAHPKVRELLEPLKKELSFFWTCPFSGLNFRAKLDGASSRHFIELKTTGDASPEFFSKHIFDMNWDLSLVHYRNGVKAIMDVEPPAYFIAIEREPPYTVQPYLAGPGVWETGHHKWLDAVTKLSDGLQKNQWPAYFDMKGDIPEINPPPWAINKVTPKGDF